MTAADDLVEFLLARITEDEAEARLATTIIAAPNGLVAFPETATCSSAPTRTLSMDRHRLLDECEAKRKIIAPALPQDADMLDWPDESPAEGKARRQGAAQALHFTLCHLATVYSDHPDFRPEWAHPGRRP